MQKEHFKQESSCASCRHYDRKGQVCRRNPPQVSVVMAPMPGNIATGGRPGVGPVPVAAFPPINSPADEWCGEWSGKLEALQ